MARDQSPLKQTGHIVRKLICTDGGMIDQFGGERGAKRPMTIKISQLKSVCLSAPPSEEPANAVLTAFLARKSQKPWLVVKIDRIGRVRTKPRDLRSLRS